MSKKILLKDLILAALEKSVDGYVRVEDFLYNPHIYARGYERTLKKSNLSKMIRSLRVKGYVDTEKDGKKLILKLTEKGRNEAILNKMLESKEWDGIWRVVVFDIPERMKKVRDIFRGRLKIWGFKHWQKSVWISKKPVGKVLKDYIKEIGIDDWVKVIETKHIE